MNKELLLKYICLSIGEWIDYCNKSLEDDPEATIENYDEWRINDDFLKEALYELYSRREKQCVYPPETLPGLVDKAVEVVRQLYKDDVSKVSLVLHRHFPDDFLYFRVSKLNEEIFRAFEFFADVVPELAFDFPRMRRNNFDEYLAVNQALLTVARRWWPDVPCLQNRIDRLLYFGLAELFLERSDYNRYWICNTQHEYWENRLSEDGVIGWSGRKDMQEGDVVFMYCSAPVKAITDIYQVVGPPRFDPYGAWDGFWVDIQHVCTIPDYVPFSVLRSDSLLREWSVVRRNFQGVVTETVPHAYYNRLLELIPRELCVQHGLKPEEVSSVAGSGQFATEEQFENEVIEPLLKSWGLSFQRQYRCKCHFGTQVISGYVDFLVSNAGGCLTLFENKLKIVNESQLAEAIKQAKSYALMLGVPSFIVASPEGMRLFSYDAASEQVVAERTPNGDKSEEDSFVEAMMRLQKR